MEVRRERSDRLIRCIGRGNLLGPNERARVRAERSESEAGVSIFGLSGAKRRREDGMIVSELEAALTQLLNVTGLLTPIPPLGDRRDG